MSKFRNLNLRNSDKTCDLVVNINLTSESLVLQIVVKLVIQNKKTSGSKRRTGTRIRTTNGFWNNFFDGIASKDQDPSGTELKCCKNVIFSPCRFIVFCCETSQFLSVWESAFFSHNVAQVPFSSLS